MSGLKKCCIEILETNNKIISYQYGFFGQDTLVPLNCLNVCEDVSTYMELHCDFDCIYLEFPKAFDRVPHQKLIYKISDIGIQRKPFIMDYIFVITQKAKSNVYASRTIKDLHIIFKDNFKFEEHMSIIINNDNSMGGIIKKILSMN